MRETLKKNEEPDDGSMSIKTWNPLKFTKCFNLISLSTKKKETLRYCKIMWTTWWYKLLVIARTSWVTEQQKKYMVWY